MKNILVIALLLTSSISFGQKISYSISASYNQAFIEDIKKDLFDSPSLPYITNGTYPTKVGYILEDYSSKSGGKINLKLNYHIASIFFLETGIQFSLVRFNKFTSINIPTSSSSNQKLIPYSTMPDTEYESFNITSDSQGYSTHDVIRIGNQSILYTEIPLNFGVSFFDKKLNFSMGVLTSFMTYSLVYTQIIENDYSGEDFTQILLSGIIEMDYQIYRNIGINVNYTHSFNPVHVENASIGKPKLNIFSLGLSYHFSTKS